ncbi:MAG: hypothetical protein HWD61_00740 [Parachlamydiaceae bacterium]|nr:MAG: hypothetical protein HWD61_00740 [Parachlamydiaceae bacterium]
MKIVPYQNLDAIPAAEIQACKKGKWSDWKRSFIVETDKNVNIVVLNFFQRAARLIQAIFHINYFKSIFGEKRQSDFS